MKWCHAPMEIINHETIKVGLLIVNNIKFIVGASQRAYGKFCIINVLCMLVGVRSHPDDVMVSPMMSINKSVMRRILTQPTNEGDQEQQQDEKDQFYHPDQLCWFKTCESNGNIF